MSASIPDVLIRARDHYLAHADMIVLDGMHAYEYLNGAPMAYLAAEDRKKPYRRCAVMAICNSASDLGGSGSDADHALAALRRVHGDISVVEQFLTAGRLGMIDRINAVLEDLQGRLF